MTQIGFVLSLHMCVHYIQGNLDHAGSRQYDRWVDDPHHSRHHYAENIFCDLELYKGFAREKKSIKVVLLVSGKGCGLWLWHSLHFYSYPFLPLETRNTKKNENLNLGFIETLHTIAMQI